MVVIHHGQSRQGLSLQIIDGKLQSLEGQSINFSLMDANLEGLRRCKIECSFLVLLFLGLALGVQYFKHKSSIWFGNSSLFSKKKIPLTKFLATIKFE